MEAAADRQKECEASRKRGSAFLRDGLHLEAVAAFTRSLALAPTAASRGLAYAGRSAVLEAAGHFRQAADDARRALGLDYPDLLKYKLHLRMAVCRKTLGQHPEAEESLRQVTELIQGCQLPEEKKGRLLEEAADEFRAVAVSKGQGLCVRYLDAPELSHGWREEGDKRLSSAVEVKKDEKFGRHLLAARDINTGDVLLVETPLIAFLLEAENFDKGHKEALWTHCSHCYEMCLNLEPCPDCPWALYCSDECRKGAWSGYHQLECRMRRKYDLLKAPCDPDSSGSWTRIMIKALSTLTPAACLENSPRVAEILSLLPDVYDDEKLERIRKLAKTICAACCEELSAEQREQLAKVCERILLVFQRNSYTIDESHFVPSIDAFRSREVIGRAMYPTVALMNHSCDANTTRVYHLGTQVVRAIRPIKKGEQIFSSYGPEYGGMPKSRRQAILRKKFYFECDCDSCDDDWPLIGSTMGQVPEFLRQPIHIPLLKEVN
ncbi:Hypothetical predicted protein [Cloeon dipterum]|uniref:Protein-lysine N-methyltransferase SMYD4 n=2 Tax=Cloeon dipterum TaxID=197152 RepID=A0A8S1DLV5_9INSE|nr:Hypothetical predicted protein [Cloeon dipterum]